MSLSAVCVGGALRRSGGYSFAGELDMGHDLSITPLSAPPVFHFAGPSPLLGGYPCLPPSFCNASTTLTSQCFSRVDVAHLVLYHLSVCCKKKYFDFDREILPFTSENWDSLLLGEVRGGEPLGVRVDQGDAEKWGRGSLLS